ncbi:MAG TPA: malto-oligosyltrehalose synthase, partial [Fimbriiglobus sp.]
DSLAQAERWSRDFTLNGLRHALREVIACFPVYRSYVDGVVKSSDRISIQRAVRRARTRNPLLGRAVFDFIRDTLLLRDPPSGPASDEYRAAQQQFVGKFQQLTPPVMAKGCEDTSFYVYNRLISLNEVGGDPARFGWAPDRVHQFLGERAEKSPGGLSPLATHDTKRGEDVRARLNVLSERPAEWGRRLAKWRELNRVHKVDLGDELLAPDPNEEYLIYQTLIGTRPLASDDDVGYVARIAAYMNKAVLEAKVHSSWINPEPEYLDAVKRFVEAILDPAQSGEFLAELDAFVAIIARYGMVNSLAQTLVRCTGPGVPDFFQGTELWDLSLVDPDNRRPVDFSIRAEWLRSLDIGRVDLADLVANMADGRIKLFLISRALRARRDNASLFAAGKYVPLTVIGAKANHVFAFLRVHDSASALVVVPRLLGGLNSGDSSLSESSIWGDTAIVLPPEMARYRWTNVFTDELILPTPSFSIDQILHVLPVALLTTRNNQM